MAVSIKPKDIVSYIFLKFFNEHEEKIFTVDISTPLIEFFNKASEGDSLSLADKLPSPDAYPAAFSFLKSSLDELGITNLSERTPIGMAFTSASRICSGLFSILLPYILNSKLATGEIRSRLEKPGDIIPFLQVLFYALISNKPTFFNQLFTIIQKGSKDAKKTISGINEQIKKAQLEALKPEFIRIFEIYMRTAESRTSGETRQFDDKQTLLINMATQLRPLLSGGSS
jgi:hypothetical protein